MITDGQNGFLVDFFDIEAIANKTLEVLRDPDAYLSVRENAVRFVQDGYSVDAVLPKMLAMYEQTVASA